MYRTIGFLFLILSALGGYTVSGGYLEIALINAVVFLALALLVVRWIAPRFGRQGLVYGMGAAFLISLIWPIAVLPFILDPPCEGEDCEMNVTISASPPVESQVP